MSGKVFIVTGGAGFIGSNLVHFLLKDAEQEYNVKVDKVLVFDSLTYAGNLSNLDDFKNDPRLEFFDVDICDREKVKELVFNIKCDGIFHLAAESHVDRSIDHPEVFVKTNVLGTFNLLDISKDYIKSGKSPKGFRFLHVSTDEVFGALSLGDEAFNENTPYAPNSPYSASKAGSDNLVRSYFHTYELPVVTTNCSNNYGPFQFPEKFIPLMISKVLNDEKIPVYGKGDNIRDWLYVVDHCRGLLVAMLKGRLGEVYCIGGKNEMTNLEMVQCVVDNIKSKVEKFAGRGVETFYEFVKDRPGHDFRYVINCSKIENELGWEPRESFSTGVDKTVDWYLNNSQWLEGVMSKSSYFGTRLGKG